jgi:hypothetical protein
MAGGALVMTNIDFDAINRAALSSLQAIVQRWLPDGKREGHEWVSLNPRRADRRRGSFKVNLQSGRWSDFATGDKGGDPVSLAAYLYNMKQGEAAINMAEMLGVSHDR